MSPRRRLTGIAAVSAVTLVTAGLTGTPVTAQDDESTAELLAMFQAFGASEEEAAQILSAWEAMGIDPSTVFAGMDPEMLAALAGADGQIDQAALMELVLGAAGGGAIPGLDEDLFAKVEDQAFPKLDGADKIPTDDDELFAKASPLDDQVNELYAALVPVYEQLGLDVGGILADTATADQFQLPGLCQDWKCVVPVYEALGMDTGALFAKASPLDDQMDELYAALVPVYEQLGMDTGELLAKAAPPDDELPVEFQQMVTALGGAEALAQLPDGVLTQIAEEAGVDPQLLLEAIDPASEAALQPDPSQEAFIKIDGVNATLDEAFVKLGIEPGEDASVTVCFPDVCLDGTLDPLQVQAMLQILDEQD